VADGLVVGEADGELVGLGEVLGEDEAVGEGVGLPVTESAPGNGPTVGPGEPPPSAPADPTS